MTEKRKEFCVQITEAGILFSEGKGNPLPEDHDSSEDWHDFEKMSDKKVLFDRISIFLDGSSP